MMDGAKTRNHVYWQPTFRATAEMQSLTFIGSAADCERWLDAVMGREATVAGKDGETRVVGIVTKGQTERMP